MKKASWNRCDLLYRFLRVKLIKTSQKEADGCFDFVKSVRHSLGSETQLWVLWRHLGQVAALIWQAVSSSVWCTAWSSFHSYLRLSLSNSLPFLLSLLLYLSCSSPFHIWLLNVNFMPNIELCHGDTQWPVSACIETDLPFRGMHLIFRRLDWWRSDQQAVEKGNNESTN